MFLNFLGVPIVDMSFNGPYGVYHSVYDNHLWMDEVRRPRLRPPCGDDAAVGRDGAAPGERATSCRSTTARQRLACASSSARWSNRRGPATAPALKPLDGAADRFAASADAAGRRMDALLAGASTDEKASRRPEPRADEHRARVPARRRHPRPAVVPSSHLRAEADLRARKCSRASPKPSAAGDRKRIDAQVAHLVGRARSGRGVLQPDARATR